MTVDQPHQLVVGEHLGLGQPVQPLGRHAVAAAQVAPVGHRDAQVTTGATEAVEQARGGQVGHRCPMYVAYRVHVLRRLVTPRWLGALLLAVLAGVRVLPPRLVAVPPLRGQGSSATSGSTPTTAPTPVPLSSVLTPAGLDPDDEWTRVTVTGQYAGGPVYVRNRPLETEPGYEVLWAFRPATGGPDVVVDRGWVAESQRGASVLPDVPPAPTRRRRGGGLGAARAGVEEPPAARPGRSPASTCATRPPPWGRARCCPATCCSSPRPGPTARRRRARRLSVSPTGTWARTRRTPTSGGCSCSRASC